MPVLLLWGGADPISPMRVEERLEEVIPKARLMVFPEAGHDLGWSHARAVAGLVGEHLRN